MSKKIFTILLLAVFMLAQFSFVAAAPAGITAAGVSALTTTNQASVFGPSVNVNWSYAQAGFAAPATTIVNSVLIWSRVKAVPPAAAVAYTLASCKVAKVFTYPLGIAVAGSTNTGTFAFTFTPAAVAGSTIEFLLTVDDSNTAAAGAACAGGTVTLPGAAGVPTSSVLIDAAGPASTNVLTAPAFSQVASTNLTWSVAGLPAGFTHYVMVLARLKSLVVPAVLVPWTAPNCRIIATVNTNVANANGVYTYVYPAPVATGALAEVEFKLLVANSAATDTVVGPPATGCSGVTIPTATLTTELPDTQTTIDSAAPVLFSITPPTKAPVAAAGVFTNTLPLACNKFAFWGFTSDKSAVTGVSGVAGPITLVSTGTFPPAPVGTNPVLNAWVGTLPATASGAWAFNIAPKDAAGNATVGGVANSQTSFRNLAAVAAAEKAACKSFTDTVGNANELYINYLATLGLISGTTTTTYDPSANLTRAQAATLFVRANGQGAALPATAPSVACTFGDILDSANAAYKGFIWQACANGWIKGYVAGTATTPGTFGPSDTFLRRDIAQIFNNIATTPGAAGSFLAANSTTYRTVLNSGATLWALPSAGAFRTIAWSDVAIGDYFVAGANSAYQSGVMEATGATTFGPLLPVTRGDFANMLYRALSRIN